MAAEAEDYEVIFRTSDYGLPYRLFINSKTKAGIEKTGGVHVFARHTPASIMIAKGCSIPIVKEVLRHRDIRTTLRYAHAADKTNRERYEQYLVL